jgi:S1-C subfamily serine protease
MASALASPDPCAHLRHKEVVMVDPVQDELTRLSEALAARTASAQRHVAAVRVPGARMLSATVWRAGVAVASDQVFPRTSEIELVADGGRTVTAQVAGRDAATNVVALRFAPGTEAAVPLASEPQLGALALMLSADRDGMPVVRLTLQRSVGPAWHSLAGGRIDRRIVLDAVLSRGEEGGPVFDAAGGLLGMSTAGPRGRALVIPAATIERVLTPLLAAGRIERGWLGAALHPVALPANVADAGALDRGLMVLRLDPNGPAARAGVMVGDILLGVGDAPARYPGEISRRLGSDTVGKQLSLHLIRAGAVQTLTATITARPAE